MTADFFQASKSRDPETTVSANKYEENPRKIRKFAKVRVTKNYNITFQNGA